MSAFTPIMPRPNLPPTPQPSTDITGKSSANAPQLETSFNLPPAALGGRGSVASSSGKSENASDSSYRPPSPSSPVATSKPGHARKRSQQSIITKDDYSLPPPPTRSRKIIQMKPKDTQETPKTSSKTQDAKTTTAATNGTKRKQAGNATAAGRKIARKTAHSLIERRRRSKMNEEFGVLKDMIPACRGQEMHKLAILQVLPDTHLKSIHILTHPGIHRVHAIPRAVRLRPQDRQLPPRLPILSYIRAPTTTSPTHARRRRRRRRARRRNGRRRITHLRRAATRPIQIHLRPSLTRHLPLRPKRIHPLHHHIPSHHAPRSSQRPLLGEPLPRAAPV